MNPEQASMEPLLDDKRDTDLKRLAMKAHLEARQQNDLRVDLARRLKPSEGPFKPGERVFFWSKDHSKIKDTGQWISGKVLAHLGPMVTIEVGNAVHKVNQSKVRRNHDKWHDIPLPPLLEIAEDQGPPRGQT
jgi:hypothetical protein